MLLEFCAENFQNIPEAIHYGADRIELCDNLAVGGTTPSFGVIQQTMRYCKNKEVPVMCMIRPRGGNFVFDETEVAIMKTDIRKTAELDVDGIVLGCLTERKRIDKENMLELLAAAEGMDSVFHMAFDEIEKDRQKDELDWLISQGVTRILTHGGIGNPIMENAGWINELIEHAGGKVEILPGGGVHHENLPDIKKVLNTDQFHGTRIVNWNRDKSK